jgi:DNA invertase Pin-like site-specific DNA recombinase
MKRECPLPVGAHVWAYFRDSGGEGQERSVNQQLDFARGYSTKHGIHLTLTFADEARTGSTTVKRDALQDMLAKARQLAPSRKERHPEAPDGILFWDTRRLGRDQLDNAFIKADLRRRGYVLIFLSDDIPDVGDFTPVIEAFLDWKAEQDLKDIGKDVQRGLHDLARKGYHPGGFPPRGYKAEQVQVGVKRNGEPRYASRWVPDPSTAHLARKAWEMRAAGASYLEVQKATKLYKGRNCWVTFFQNKTYLGIVKCGELEIPDAHEPLCTPEQWAAVQAQNSRRRKPKPWHASSDYLLTGLIHCGYCGSACSGGSDTNDGAWGARSEPWRYYVCGNQKRKGWGTCELGKVNANKVEKAVIQQVFDRILTRDYLSGLLEEVRRSFNIEELQKDLGEGRQHLRELDRVINGLVDAIEQSPSSALMLRLAERERERDEVLARVAALEIQHRNHENTQIDAQTLDLLVDELRRGLEADHDTVRDTLQRIVTKVEIKKDGGTLYLRVPLCAVLSVSTPGATRTPAHGSGGRCSIH